MKEKLLAIWSKVKPCWDKAYAWSPFACGVAVGWLLKWLL